MAFPLPCPVCHALLQDTSAGIFDCPLCSTELYFCGGDRTGHEIGEIDPEFERTRLGVLHGGLHPKGTLHCSICGTTYPEAFEQCPGLVDLALKSYKAKRIKLMTAADDREIAEFLQNNPIVVENRIRTHAFDRRLGNIKKSDYKRIQQAAESLGMSDWLKIDEI